ncbi:hypothetical protein [Brevibacterium album]|uniref:hypothetical protein n=1 Tax=Brevibacterium album TaxID=417948 RepID=UPI000411752D|nr:hypothetical protein [Brevibacterium album]
MDQRAETQQDTFTLRAGSAGIRLGLRNLLKNGPILLAAVAIWGFRARWNGHSWAEVFERVGWIVGGALAVAMLYLWLYGRSSVTVTSSELIVRRFGRKQSMLRDAVGEIIEGERDWGTGREAAPAFYWFITDRSGRRFVALPQTQWPVSGLEDLARALQVAPRRPRNSDEERQLAPWWMRHIFLAALVLGLVLTVVVGLIWWGGAAWQDARRAAAEQSAEHSYIATIEPQLTKSRYPSLQEIEHDVVTSPLRVSGYAEDLDDVILRPSVSLVGTENEIPATETLELLDLQCSYSTPEAAVSVSTVNYASAEEGRYERTVEFKCGMDRSPLETWLAWAEENSVGANVSAVNVTRESSYDGEQLLDIGILVEDYSDADFRAMVDHLCTYPEADALRMRINEELGSQSAPINCGLPEYSLGEWQNSRDR